jgi:hypothetical protein
LNLFEGNKLVVNGASSTIHDAKLATTNLLLNFIVGYIAVVVRSFVKAIIHV